MVITALTIPLALEGKHEINTTKGEQVAHRSPLSIQFIDYFNAISLKNKIETRNTLDVVHKLTIWLIWHFDCQL